MNPFELCKPQETWGPPQAAGESDDRNWGLTCDTNKAQFECRLGANAIDVTLVGTRPLNTVPDIRFLTSGNVRGGDTLILVDGIQRVPRRLNDQFLPENFALAAELCGAGVLKNVDQGREVSLKGFCPKLGIMLNRLLTCSGPTGGLGGEITEPDPTAFDADNFISPAITDNGEYIEFSAVRLNEGFYIKPDQIGNLSITIEAGDNCETRYHADFPVNRLGPGGIGMGRDLFTDKRSPVVLRYGSKFSMGHEQSYYDLVIRSQFHVNSYKCYRATVLAEFYFKFEFLYKNRHATIVYRLPDLPKMEDLSVSTVEQLEELKAAFDHRVARVHISTVFQEIAIAFNMIGLPTNWKDL